MAQQAAIVTEMAIGVGQGRAKEYVFNPDGTTLSRLDWDINNVPMLNAGIYARPFDWFKIGLKVSTNLADWSHMNDYDFNLAGCPPAPGGGSLCVSNHPDTRLESAWLLDASVSADVLKQSGLTVSLLAGYKTDYFSWRAYNGTSNYAGDFNSGLGISYEQYWRAPYLGLGLQGATGPWSYTGRIIGSLWGEASDRDHHHMRSLVFKETFKTAKFLGIDVSVGYQLSPTTRATLGYSYQNWFLTKGTTDILDLLTGTTTTITGDAAGASNVLHMVSLGIVVELSPPMALAAGKGSAPVAPHKWEGFYAGAMIGAKLHDHRWTSTEFSGFGVFAPTAQHDFDFPAPLPSLFAGYTGRWGSMLIGVEGEIGKDSGSAYSKGLPGDPVAGPLVAASPDSIVIDPAYDVSLRARLGTLAAQGLMVYATAGLAGQKLDVVGSCSMTGPWCVADRYDRQSGWRWGWTVGAGLEAAMNDNWFLRGEYRYTKFGSSNEALFANAPLDTVTGKLDSSNHRVSVGIGRRF